MDTPARITAWFRANARDLPWRSPETTAWQVLVSEIMLQQTPAARVAPAYLAWINRWPDAQSLSEASQAQVLRQWDRLGYPRRALRLHEAARIVSTTYLGEVPNDYELLTRLPGVGDYTASAVLAFAFGRRSVVLDTNIRRVLARAWHGEQFPTSQVSVAERAFADSLTPQSDKRAAMWSAAVMELGAVICTARSPLCAECPIKTECVWLAAGYPESQVPRRTQAFKGTDRQMRGRMMEALRSNHGSTAEKDLLALCPEREQADRVLKSLITDGLAVKVRANRYRLPD